jgi:hypothetical protein
MVTAPPTLERFRPLDGPAFADWAAVLEALREHAQGAEASIDRASIVHPAAAGAVRSVGLPRGQVGDWRFPPLGDGAGLHVQDFGQAGWRAHLDAVHPSVSLRGHLEHDMIPALNPWTAHNGRRYAMGAVPPLVGADPSSLGFVPTEGGGYDATDTLLQGSGVSPQAGVVLQNAAADSSWWNDVVNGKDPQETAAAFEAIDSTIVSLVGTPALGVAFLALQAAVFEVASAIFGNAQAGAGGCAGATPSNPYGSQGQAAFEYMSGQTITAVQADTFAAYFGELAMADWNNNANCLYTNGGDGAPGWSPEMGFMRWIALLGPAIAAWNATHAGEEAGAAPVTYTVQACADTSCAGQYGTGTDPLSATLNALGTMTGPLSTGQYAGLPTPSVADGTPISITVNGGTALPTLPDDVTVMIVVVDAEASEGGAMIEVLPPQGGVWSENPQDDYTMDVSFTGGLAFDSSVSQMLENSTPAVFEYTAGQGGGSAVAAWTVVTPRAGSTNTAGEQLTSMLVVVDQAYPLPTDAAPVVVTAPSGAALCFTPSDTGGNGFSKVVTSGLLSFPYEAIEVGNALIEEGGTQVSIVEYGGGPAAIDYEWTDSTGALQQASVQIAALVLPLLPASALPPSGLQVIQMEPGDGVEIELPTGAAWAENPDADYTLDLAFSGDVGYPAGFAAPELVNDSDTAVVVYAAGETTPSGRGGWFTCDWTDASGAAQSTTVQVVDVVASAPGNGQPLSLPVSGPCVIALYPPNGGGWPTPQNVFALTFTGALEAETLEAPIGMSSPQEAVILYFGGGSASVVVPYVDGSGTPQTATVNVTGGTASGGGTGGTGTDGGSGGGASVSTLTQCQEFVMVVGAAAGASAGLAPIDAVLLTDAQKSAPDELGQVTITGTYTAAAPYAVPAAFTSPATGGVPAAVFPVVSCTVTGTDATCQASTGYAGGSSGGGSSGGGSSGGSSGGGAAAPSGAGPVLAVAAGGGLLAWLLLS